MYAPPPTPGASHANDASDARSSRRQLRTSASSGALVDAADDAEAPFCFEEPFHRQRTSPPRVKATMASSISEEGGVMGCSEREREAEREKVGEGREIGFCCFFRFFSPLVFYRTPALPFFLFANSHAPMTIARTAASNFGESMACFS